MGERGTEVPIAGKTLRSCSTVGNRPVRTRTQGGVGGGGRKSPRLPDYAWISGTINKMLLATRPL